VVDLGKQPGIPKAIAEPAQERSMGRSGDLKEVDKNGLGPGLCRSGGKMGGYLVPNWS
jgi:hypothetical protein